MTKLPPLPVRFAILAIVAACAAKAPQRDDHVEAAAVRTVVEQFLRAQRGGAAAAATWQPLLTGEAAEHWRDAWPGLGTEVDMVRTAAQGRAVARTHVEGKQRRENLYLYVVHTPQGWRIETVRGFAQMALLEEIVRLAGDAPEDPEIAATVANARLVLLDDEGLRAWFVAHRDELDTLTRAAGSLAQDQRVRAEDDNGTGRTLRRLALNSLHRSGDHVYVSVGGLADNEVGFVLATDGLLPAISANDHIWIEPLAGGWHLFRTT